ncbi:MAG: FAD-dependent oxidoreductase, partial [Actinobacteria bacterium]|nr:FAD-dependent oxidoreductase [Actinomycetota bacterium]
MIRSGRDWWREVAAVGGERHGFVIVGSGAGGATLARELARRGADVLVVERGRPAARLGSFAGAARLYDVAPVTNVPAKSREGVILWRAFAAGGSTVVACGNMTRCLEEELSQLGIDLEAELAEAEAEMGVAPIAPALLSPGAHALRAAAAEIGCVFTPMPTAIDPLLCRGCAACTLGCAREAKWTARRYLRDVEEERHHPGEGKTPSQGFPAH